MIDDALKIRDPVRLDQQDKIFRGRVTGAGPALKLGDVGKRGRGSRSAHRCELNGILDDFAQPRRLGRTRVRINRFRTTPCFPNRRLFACSEEIIDEIPCLCGQTVPVSLEDADDVVYCPCCDGELRPFRRVGEATAPEPSEPSTA